MSRLHELHAAGQAIWLDYIDRDLVRSGELERRLASDALSGMTSNPTIFEKALAQSSAYDAQIAASGAETVRELFEEISTEDVRSACDVFASVYEATHGADGFVSIEVSPSIAHDVAATVAEAGRLWSLVDRPNVMIKVPGTAAGIDACRELIAQGVNVNVTLLFSIAAHGRVIDAYIQGLEARAAAGEDVAGVASVASFFVSRVDTAVDGRLDAMVAAGALDAARATALKGKAAVANAKLAYRLARASFAGARWQALAARGARMQRPLWASTSTKNPHYRDVLYVEELIGPDTVNTMPPATLDAFRDHGVVARTVDADVDGAVRHLAELEGVGVSVAEVTDQLLVDGLVSFQKSFDSLLTGLDRKSRALGRELVAAR